MTAPLSPHATLREILVQNDGPFVGGAAYGTHPRLESLGGDPRLAIFDEAGLGAVRDITLGYLHAGTTMPASNTFGLQHERLFHGSGLSKSEVLKGRADAYRLVEEASEKFASDTGSLVVPLAAVRTPGDTDDPTLYKYTPRQRREIVQVSLQPLISAGARHFLVETVSTRADATALFEGLDAEGIDPADVIFSWYFRVVNRNGKEHIELHDGTPLEEAVEIADKYNVAATGGNCGSPRLLREVARYLGGTWGRPIVAYPNGLSEREESNTGLTPEEDPDFARRLRDKAAISLPEFGEVAADLADIPEVMVLGGCCKTNESHVHTVSAYAIAATHRRVRDTARERAARRIVNAGLNR